MGLPNYMKSLKAWASHTADEFQTQPIVVLKRMRGQMASLLTWLIGISFVVLGFWILFLRVEGFFDRIQPRSLSIGHVTVDGQENRGFAELLRARYDHHFRRPAAIPRETGFLELVSLDAPQQLFQQKGQESTLENVTLDVSGVDVARVVKFANQLVKPEEWLIEGDFQTQSDRALLALRLSRGDRVVRTWYLERVGDTSHDKSILLEKLVDDAVFQVVYDFGNVADSNADLRKWHEVVKLPTSFPSREAVAAYYQAKGALTRYYTHGDWADLDDAVTHLQDLRAEMPEYADGLQLLGMALAERRNDTEAIHVYEQLQGVLLPRKEDWSQLTNTQKRRKLSVDLLKATARTNLYVWQSTHQAIGELVSLNDTLRTESASLTDDHERAAYGELQAQTDVQLAYAYATYLLFVRQYQVADMFGPAADAPVELRVTDNAEISDLRGGPSDRAKPIVRRVMRTAAKQHDMWIDSARQIQKGIDWRQLSEPERRKAELTSRLQLAVGYASYRMAELEPRGTAGADTIFGKTFDERLEESANALRRADASHPDHYLVLQLLGLVASEPRLERADLGIGEQYFDRAIRANPSDGYGHELLAGLLLRRVANMGVDLPARTIVQKGFEESGKAVSLRDASGNAHLLRAQFQMLLLELERNEANRRELLAALQQYIDQADRFLPTPFGRPDVDLSWVRIVATVRGLLDKTHDVSRSKTQVFEQIDRLIEDCKQLEDRWVASQRVFQVKALHDRAVRLKHEVEQAKTPENWRAIRIPLL